MFHQTFKCCMHCRPFFLKATEGLYKINLCKHIVSSNGAISIQLVISRAILLASLQQAIDSGAHDS